MEQLDFDKLRYFVYSVILRVNLYFVLLKSFFGSACGKLFGDFEIDKSKQAESLSYITCDRVTYVVSWLNDMKAVSETVMSSSPLDIMVTEMSWMSPLGRCQMSVITCLTLPGCQNCRMPSPVSCLTVCVSLS